MQVWTWYVWIPHMPAVELLKDYLDVYPASRHADEVNFLIGSAHFGQGEYQKAIFWFNESNIDMLSPEQQEAYCFRLAYSLLQIGDMEKARGYFARIEQIGTKNWNNGSKKKYNKKTGCVERIKDNNGKEKLQNLSIEEQGEENVW